MLNLDLGNESYEGRLTLVNDKLLEKVSVVAQAKINKNKLDISTGKFVGEIFDFLPINIEKRRVGKWKEFTKISDDQIPKTGEVSGCLGGEGISGRWTINKCYEGEFKLKYYSSKRPSCYPSTKISSWEEFKNNVLKDSQYQKHIFRGQTKQWRLRTLFHRTGRADLNRYTKEDIPILYRYLSAFPNCRFDLSKKGELGALLALAQHHGYPTPLLDWTHSPYVAAYFAYADLKKEECNNDEFVRILIFDVDSWVKKKKYSSSLTAPLPTFTYLEPLSIGNNRMLPQQSVTMFSNIDDIESYIMFCEGNDKLKYLRIYDLPVRERTTVMRDLDYMGITASSLFPGLDGTCRALKEKYF
ncbi:MAG: FRG domain-containing protein [Planctomycetes bacterium]|nr:FRG domain-containing protein [Planctomycetota bacterium]